MRYPAMIAVTLNTNAHHSGAKAFPIEFAWLCDDGPIRAALVSPKREWLTLPLPVEEHGITWETLHSGGSPLKEVISRIDSDLANQVAYCYRRDYQIMQMRQGTFESRWFETPDGHFNPKMVPWQPAISIRSATMFARKTTATLPPWKASTRIIYALNYYSMLVSANNLPAFLDRWTQEGWLTGQQPTTRHLDITLSPAQH